MRYFKHTCGRDGVQFKPCDCFFVPQAQPSLPRETFDAEAVRALLNEITDAAREGRLNCPSVHILSKRVRDSERK